MCFGHIVSDSKGFKGLNKALTAGYHRGLLGTLVTAKVTWQHTCSTWEWQKLS